MSVQSSLQAEIARLREEFAMEKADRDRLWAALFNAQCHWIETHDSVAHQGWQRILVETGVPV